MKSLKKHILLYFFGALLVGLTAVACGAGSGEKETAQAQIASINASIEQLKAMDRTLQTAISSLQSADAATRELMEAQRSNLQNQIAALEEYVNRALSSEKAWEEGQFATKEQAAALLSRVNTLQQAVDAIAAGSGNGIDPEALAQLQAGIDALSLTVNTLTGRLDAVQAQLEEIVGMIQSVQVIPDYAGGGVAVSSSEVKPISFEVRPQSAAQKLQSLPLGVYSLKAVYTQVKGSVEHISLTLKSVSYNGAVVTLFVQGDALSSDFYSEEVGASACLDIEAGVNAITSDYFPLVPVK